MNPHAFRQFIYRMPFLIGILFLLQCASSQPHTFKTQRIGVEHEKMCLGPITGLETFAKMPRWPKDSALSLALFTELEPVRDNILAELRRCEKLGLYTIVDSAEGPTVFLSVSLSFKEEWEDTIFVRYTMRVDNRASEKKHSVEGTFSRMLPKDTTMSDFYRIGHVLSQFRRDFPVKSVVSIFYPQQP